MGVSESLSTAVFASAYLRPATSGGGVIAVANWDDKETQQFDLVVDWSAFGIAGASDANVTAPAIANYQPSLTLDPTK